MSKKHLIIKDADEDLEYDITEISDPDDTQEEIAEEEVTETEEADKKVCPECGKNPCECEEHNDVKDVIFTEEEFAALKELISLVPDLKKLLEEKPKEGQEETSKKQEQTETKIEEIQEEPEEIVKEDLDESEDLDEIEDSISDSIGSLEHAIGDSVVDECDSLEVTMAERYKKYYGGN